MTSSSLIKQSEKAHNLYKTLIITLRGAREKVVYGGKLLFELHKNNLFKKSIGEGGIDTWEDFIKQPEIGLSRGEATRMMEIYEWFVLELDVTEEELLDIPVKALHYLLPVAKSCQLTVEEMGELIDDAKVLSQTDLRERIGEVKYPDLDFHYEFLIMKKCLETGTMKKVHNIKSDDIKDHFNL